MMLRAFVFIFFLIYATPLLAIPEYFQKADAINEFIYKSYYVNADGSYEMTLKMQVKIKTYNGKITWADYKYPYNSEYEKVEVKEAETILPSGKVIKVNKKEIQDILDPSTSESSIYSKARIKVINFPSVEIGSRIKFTILVKSKWGFWAKESFRLVNPTFIKKVTVKIPSHIKLKIKLKDKKVIFSKKVQGKYTIYSWTGKMLPPIYRESFAPEIENQPFCLLISSFSTKKIASFFYKRISIKEKSFDLPKWAKEKDPDLLYKNLLSHIRIYPIALFCTSLRVQDPLETLKKSYGSSLDVAVLFNQLLKKNETESHLIFVNTSGVFLKPIEEVLYPALFDQVLVRVKHRFYAFVNKDIPPGITNIAGSYGLEIDSSRLIQIKDNIDNITKKELSITVFPQGHGIGSFSLSCLGYSTVNLRKTFRNADPEEFRIGLSEILHKIDPTAKLLGKAKLYGVSKLTKKANLSFKFKLNPVLMKSGYFYLFPIPTSDILETYCNCSLKRHYGISIAYTKTEYLIIDIKLPKRLKPILMPANSTGRVGLLEWQIHSKWHNGKIQFTRKITLRRGIIREEDAILMLRKIRDILQPQNNIILLQN